MTRRIRITHTAACAVTAIGLLLGTARHAGAAEALFGFSSYDEAETLTVGLSGGGSVVLNTGGNQGWWSATFTNTIGNTNYFVGNPLDNSSPQYLRNFFTFDISDLRGQTVTGATLGVTRYIGLSDSGMTSQTYSLYDVSTPASELDLTGGTSTAIYDDLGTGKSYGSFNVPLVGPGSDNFALNATGVADLNAAIAGGTTHFSIGGTLPIPISAVPEPASVLLLGSGLLGLLGMGKRKAG
ncbi:MAG TPA: PEP-CTERM sorting domain-containing protein [Acetobacteraceae bacterium]|nr:PEP-CTERM sorting domain-containing protein [Acetobacteraceae bacterium]